MVKSRRRMVRKRRLVISRNVVRVIRRKRVSMRSMVSNDSIVGVMRVNAKETQLVSCLAFILGARARAQA